MPSLRHSLRLLRPAFTVRRAKLLGDEQAGLVVSRTADTTPELQFRFPSTPPTTITLTGPDGAGGGTDYSFPVVGGVVNVTTALPVGIYTVTSQALNGDGVLDRVTGSIEITAGVVLLFGQNNSMLLGPNTELLVST